MGKPLNFDGERRAVNGRAPAAPIPAARNAA
jgi:hypothetical protein